jgi:hypothetical protein
MPEFYEAGWSEFLVPADMTALSVPERNVIVQRFSTMTYKPHASTAMSALNIQTHPALDYAKWTPFQGIFCDGARKRSRDLNDKFISSSEHFQR